MSSCTSWSSLSSRQGCVVIVFITFIFIELSSPWYLPQTSTNLVRLFCLRWSSQNRNEGIKLRKFYSTVQRRPLYQLPIKCRKWRRFQFVTSRQHIRHLARCDTADIFVLNSIHLLLAIKTTTTISGTPSSLHSIPFFHFIIYALVWRQLGEMAWMFY